MSKAFPKDIYLFPGWGTDCRIFYQLDLPGTELHNVDYIKPVEKEGLSDYAARLIKHYDIKPNSVLMGCSLGGIIAIEISKQLPVENLVLISSVKHKGELPERITRWRGFPIDKLPTSGLIRWWVAHFSYLLNKLDERYQLKFREMVLQNDDAFLKKSIHWIVNWDNEVAPERCLHIHGDRDIIFPIEHLGEYTNMRRGDHLLLINRHKEVNELVEAYLSEDLLPFYTKNQLALRNGSDREEIWVAYQGVIYDVGESRLWKGGKHYEHWAGQDLTQELDEDAPHNREVFQKFKAVGRLQS